METMEIMNDEEVIETTEEILDEDSGNGLKKVVGIGLVGLVGFAAYRYVAKPIIAKIKARKEQQKENKVVDITKVRETKSEES